MDWPRCALTCTSLCQSSRAYPSKWRGLELHCCHQLCVPLSIFQTLGVKPQRSFVGYKYAGTLYVVATHQSHHRMNSGNFSFISLSAFHSSYRPIRVLRRALSADLFDLAVCGQAELVLFSDTARKALSIS